MKTKKFLNSLIIMALLSSCTLEPKYEKPKPEIPFEKPTTEKPKVSKISWDKFFESEDLQRIINLALENNRDLKIANFNIESARAYHSLVRSNLLPSFNARGAEVIQKSAPKKQYEANLTLSAYEIDFFGKFRTLKKSALEDLLAREEARNVTKISLIAEVVNSYAQFLLDKEIIEIAKENLEVQNKIYDLVLARFKNGVDSQRDVIDARVNVENARSILRSYEKFLEQDKNALMVLTGVFDARSLPQKTNLDDIEINEEALDMIPSKTLLSRPDIRAAEHNLKSANALIGAARAAFFPSISLTGSAGYYSTDLNNLFGAGSGVWSFIPQINVPIFSGGRVTANLELANIRKKIEIANYEKTIQTAFREALDQLSERKAVTSQLKSFEEILKLRQRSHEIAKLKYRQGVSSVLDLLDARIALLLAKQNKSTIRKQYLVNLVNLYKVLGGGSEIEEVK